MDQNGVTGTRFTLPETATIIQKNNTGKKNESGFQNTGHQAMKKREIGNKKDVFYYCPAYYFDSFQATVQGVETEVEPSYVP